MRPPDILQVNINLEIEGRKIEIPLTVAAKIADRGLFKSLVFIVILVLYNSEKRLDTTSLKTMNTYRFPALSLYISGS